MSYYVLKNSLYQPKTFPIFYMSPSFRRRSLCPFYHMLFLDPRTLGNLFFYFPSSSHRVVSLKQVSPVQLLSFLKPHSSFLFSKSVDSITLSVHITHSNHNLNTHIFSQLQKFRGNHIQSSLFSFLNFCRCFFNLVFSIL